MAERCARVQKWSASGIPRQGTLESETFDASKQSVVQGSRRVISPSQKASLNPTSNKGQLCSKVHQKFNFITISSLDAILCAIKQNNATHQ